MFDSAAEYARECGRHRSTVINWIKEGKVNQRKRIKRRTKQYYKIPECEIKKIEEFKKEYLKKYTWYTEVEDYIIINNKDKPNRVIAEMIKRDERSVINRKHKLRKMGLL